MEKGRLIITTLLLSVVPRTSPTSRSLAEPTSDVPAANVSERATAIIEPSKNYASLNAGLTVSTHPETSTANEQRWTSLQSESLGTKAMNTTKMTLMRSSATSPSPTGVVTRHESDRCELLVASSVCKSYLSNRTVFFDGQFSQKQTVQYLDSLLQNINKYKYRPGLKQSCSASIVKFVCRYTLPNCTNSKITGLTRARLCKESCESTFVQPNFCCSEFRTVLGTASAIAHNTTLLSPKHLSIDELQCDYLQTRQESNHTCFSVDLFGNTKTEKPRVPPTTLSSSANNGTATETMTSKTDSRCDIRRSPTPRAEAIQTCGEGGTVPNGTPCHFPFTYRGVEYYDCTVVSSYRPWCATEPGAEEIHNQYGYCYCSANLSDYFNSDCEKYRTSNGVCDEFMQGREVFVDLCYPQDVITNNFTNVAAESFELNLSSYPPWCAKQLMRAVCELAFPPCKNRNAGVISPAWLCKESCEQYVYGNCSSAYSRALSSLKAVRDSPIARNVKPVHFAVGIPACDSLPTIEESNGSCFSINVDLGYRVSTSEPIARKTDSNDLVLSVIVPVVVGGFCLCFITILVVFVVVRRRRKTSSLILTNVHYVNKRDSVSTKSISSSKLLLQNSSNEQGESTNAPSMKDILTSPTFTEMSSSESTFTLNTAEISVARLPEIQHNHLEYVRDLGEGQFGQVLLASWTGAESQGNGNLVAVKVLKKETGEKARADFYKELSVMAQLQHENIVKLMAKCTDEKPNCIVFEFMERGALSDFLRASRLGEETKLNDRLEVEGSCVIKHELTLHNLKAIVYQVCQALVYLSGKRFVHRDVAARNCLVGRNLEVKLADFGLSCDVYSEDYYRVGGSCVLPVRWMPPESIIYGLFTVKSDVWAFGVLMWEVFSLGQRPYFGSSNEEVIDTIRSGRTLSPPSEFCPGDIYEVMSSCWSTQPDKRPNFNEILDKL